MALSPQQLRNAILNLAKSQPEKAGEIRSSMREFSYKYDQNKLASLSNEEFARLKSEALGSNSAEDTARYNKRPELRQREQQEFIQLLSGGNSPLKELATANSAGLLDSLNSSSGLKNETRAVNIANALQKYGLSSLTADQQFSNFVGTFDPDLYLREEKARNDAFNLKAGTTPGGVGSPATGAGITFKEGLTDTQKQSIINLVNNKPTSQWNETDKANWNFATNNAPLLQMANTPSSTITPTTGANTASSIPAGVPNFISGLTQAQKDSITNLLATGRAFNETDARNYAYAIGQSNWQQFVGKTGTQITGGIGSGVDSSGTGGTIGGLTGDINSQRTALQDLGIDVSVLTDEQIKSLYLMNSAIDVNAKNDKNLIPKDLTPEEMDKFLSDAKSELSPYYQEDFDISKRDLMTGLGFNQQEINYQEQLARQQFEKEREDLSAQMAETGLARSGIRQKAEQQLKEQQTGIIGSSRRKLAQQAYELGSQFEKKYGTTGLQKAGGVSYSSADFPTLAGAETTAYTPYGGIMGTQAKEQTVAEQQRQAELAKQEMAKRQLLTTGTTA